MPVSQEAEQQIRSEFDELLVGTSKAADSQLERFMYSDGRSADFDGKKLGFKTPCVQNNAGESLYVVSTQVQSQGPTISRKEYERKIEAVRQY